MMDERSRKNLIGVHEDLVCVMEVAYADVEGDEECFHVSEGSRLMSRQRQLLIEKKTTTLKSRHIPDNNECKLSCAVDIVVLRNGKVTWDYEAYARMSKIVKAAAGRLGIEIEWGGDWTSFKDGPHYQLPKLTHP